MTRFTLSHPEEEVRQACLALAIRASDPGIGTDVIRVAEAFFAFVSGRSDASPKDRILQAMEDAGVS